MSDPADEADRERLKKQKIQRQLDEALAESFPASDPVSIVTSNEEEDWGANGTPPAAPEEPAPPSKP